jgi:hypothetical protein
MQLKLQRNRAESKWILEKTSVEQSLDWSLNGDADSSAEDGSPSPVRRERAGVRAVFYCMEPVHSPGSTSRKLVPISLFSSVSFTLAGMRQNWPG